MWSKAANGANANTLAHTGHCLPLLYWILPILLSCCRPYFSAFKWATCLVIRHFHGAFITTHSLVPVTAQSRCAPLCPPTRVTLTPIGLTMWGQVEREGLRWPVGRAKNVSPEIICNKEEINDSLKMTPPHSHQEKTDSNSNYVRSLSRTLKIKCRVCRKPKHKLGTDIYISNISKSSGTITSRSLYNYFILFIMILLRIALIT